MLKYLKVELTTAGMISFMILGSCAFQKPESPVVENSTLSPKYATGFEVHMVHGIKVLSVTRPWLGATASFSYALLPDGVSKPKELNVDQSINIPVRKMVVTSTTHIPLLDLLEASDHLAGFPQTNYISSPKMQKRIKQNKVKELGTANGMNIETLLELQPEMVMTYLSGPDKSELEKLKITGIPVVLNADFLEETPLGRAEWIKFMGHLIDKPMVADSVFLAIEQDYLAAQAKVKNVSQFPEVFSGSLYGGTWYAPGGESFMAQYIKDAAGKYSWEHIRQSGSLELNFEDVINENSNADYWIGLGGYTSFKELTAADSRYEKFKAFREGNVYNYHKRIGSNGGFEYLELGSARPDIVLKDFIKILHPQQLPDYELYFFKPLER